MPWLNYAVTNSVAQANAFANAISPSLGASQGSGGPNPVVFGKVQTDALTTPTPSELANGLGPNNGLNAIIPAQTTGTTDSQTPMMLDHRFMMILNTIEANKKRT